MKKLALALLSLAVAFAAFYVTLAESGEVVVLETHDGSGSHATRLWVVDHAGAAWLRTGDPNAAWLARLRADPEVDVTRDGRVAPYRAVLVDDAALRDTVNRLTLEKYGWRERVLRAVMTDPAHAQPIRLDPR